MIMMPTAIIPSPPMMPPTMAPIFEECLCGASEFSAASKLDLLNVNMSENSQGKGSSSSYVVYTARSNIINDESFPVVSMRNV